MRPMACVLGLEGLNSINYDKNINLLVNAEEPIN
jgi:hypothetical protein